MDALLPLSYLAGSVALLLWGTHMVQSGVQRAFGPRLRSIFGRALKTRPRAFAAGLGVTAVLQSSTATGLMATGFYAGGLVGLVPALAVMLVANVGTTLIVQTLSFDVSSFSPLLILVGVLLFRRDSTTMKHDLGRVFIGLGLMLLALHQLLDIMTPYEDSPAFRTMLHLISAAPVFDVILAAGLTWAAHSSVAVVLLVMSLADKGIVPPEAAFALVLGANLGTAINPLLEGARSDDPASRRLPLGNLLIRLLGVVVVFFFLRSASTLLMSVEGDVARAVADFHTLFNIALAALFFPLLDVFAKLLRYLVPAKVDDENPGRPRYLETHASPFVALGAATREALRLADVLETMLQGARDALAKGDRKRITETRKLDDVLDKLNTAIKGYLTSIDPGDLNEAERQRLDRLLIFSTNLEQAGDVVDRNLLAHAAKRLKRGLVFSKEGEAELIAMLDRLIVNLKTAASLLVTDDLRVARLLAEEKVTFRQSETVATHAHFERLREKRMETALTSALHLDLLRDMKLVNAHLVAAAAYPVLERTGELLPSRIAEATV
jgi:phosphate:Na+ symporter